MDDEIQLISDGDGLAVIGEPALVERFLVSQGLPAKDLGLPRLGSAFGTASGVVQVGSDVAANSGRWMKLTKESARIADSFPLVKNSSSGYLHATARAQNGQFFKNLQFVGRPVANPVLLGGVAGLMAQQAMQQSMKEITDYLATIDEKVDDILRAQKDAVLADMIGVDFVIEEAMTIREHVGRVSEVTWSKVQATSMTIGRTQAYALRQLDGLAEKVDRKASMGDLAKIAKEAESRVQEWLAVLAHCFQLQDAIAVLELDRVLDASPDELDRHRLALRSARRNRLELISRSTAQLLARMASAAEKANAKVLLSPLPARAVVNSSNHVAAEVTEFRSQLGIEGDRNSVDAKRWREAVVEVRDKALETGAGGVEAAGQLGDKALDRAKSAKSKFSSGIRAFRQAVKDQDGEDADTREINGSGPSV